MHEANLKGTLYFVGNMVGIPRHCGSSGTPQWVQHNHVDHVSPALVRTIGKKALEEIRQNSYVANEIER